MNTAAPFSDKSRRAGSRIRSRRLWLVALVALSLVASVYVGASLAMLQSPPIAIAATVRHAPVLNGRVEGSVQMLLGEYLTLNSGSIVKGDLYVPGRPNVVTNGTPIYQGTIDGTGSTQPSNYQVTLNSGSEVRHVRRRTDPVTLAPVPLPPAATGTRYVVISTPGQSVGDWATVRDLTLNSNVGSYAVPPGTYNRFTANGGGSFVLGVAGATQPSVYNFEEITLNSNSNLQVVGPVVVNVASRVSVNSNCVMGAAAKPQWLTLNVSRYDVTLNGACTLHGHVRAPAGTVTLSASTLRGSVACDRLTINGGTLQGVAPDTTPPVVSITQPAEGALVNTATVNVTGTVSDESSATVTVNGVAATLNGGAFSASVPLVEGANTLRAVATDAAGNSAEATRGVSRDTIAPTVSVAQPANGAYIAATQATVTGTFDDATATAITVNGANAALTGNNFSATVPITEGDNELRVNALDAAGNQTEVRLNVIRDTVAPTLTVAQPADGAVTADEQIVFSGTFADANPVAVMVGGVAATITGNNYTATVPIAPGPLLLMAHAVDAAGNETSVERKITVAGPLGLDVAQPTEGQLADSREVKVEGSVSGTDVRVTVNGQPFDLVGGANFGGYLNLPEGASTIRIEATDILGRTQAVVRSVTVDTTPPAITGIAPAQDALVAETSTTVSGHVSDATATTVKINDAEASVGADGVFTLANFAVSEGENIINVEATDALGNRFFTQSSFRGKDRTPPPATVVFPLPAETRLQTQQVEGRAEPGAVVSITGASQPVTAEAADGTGLFFATVTLSVGDNTLTVTNVDREGNVSAPVSLSVRYDPGLTRPLGQPMQIHISTNDAQKGLVGQELPRPLIVRVTDQTGEPVAGVPVTYTASYGGGSFVVGGQQSVVVTDDEGRAGARYIGGSTPGFQYIRADFPGNPTKPVSFAAELLQAQPGDATTASGLVLDQNMRALPNVLVRLGGQQTRTGSDGRFRLTNVPVGPHQVLELIGRGEIQLPGRWPNISYDLDVLPGVDNHLGRPLFLPRVNAGVEMPLDANNVFTRDTVYELPAVGGQPPVRVTAAAGTHVQFPPDVTDRRLSVTRIPLNRTPMTLEDGRATNLYISVQPSGAIFDPPLAISFPNLDGLAANSEVLLMSFDHDAGRYVRMGTGHVSADAGVVRSDTGSGIRVGAWHALPPDPPAKEATVLSHVQVEGNPAFTDQDVEVTEAVVLSQRAVPYSQLTNAQGVLSKVLLRAVVPMPDEKPKLDIEVVQTNTATPEIELDAKAFDYKTKELFIAEDKEIELAVAVVNGLPNSKYTVTCTEPDKKKVTVVCTDDKITIKGSKLFTVNSSGDADFHDGETEFKIQAKGTSGGKPKDAKVKVSLVRVKYKEDKANNGFDDLIKGQIQDQANPQFNASGQFIGDRYKDDPNNKTNKTKDPWLTVILNGDQTNPVAGGTQTAKYEVKPDKAASHILFESDDTTKANVAANTAQKLLTVTGNAASSTFVKAKLTSYKASTFEVGKMNVVVRPKVKVNAAFFFLRDTGGHEASLDPGSITGYVADINAILTPQTGIEYVVSRVYHWDTSKNVNVPAATTNPARLTKDFGGIVDYVEWDEIATGKLASGAASTQPKVCDPGSTRDVFIVWDVEEKDPAPRTVKTRGVWNPATSTIMTDSRVPKTMAHEIGHSFFIGPSDSGYVYFNCTNGRNNCTNDPAHSNVLRELMFAVGAVNEGATNEVESGNHIPKGAVDKAANGPHWLRGGWPKLACP